MIAMTATMRPLESLNAFPALGQNLRRHYEHTLLFTDQMFVIFPGVGVVLVTERLRKYRFDIVGTDPATMAHRVARLEADVRKECGGQQVGFEWARAASVPVPFR
ncbi:hypothetical protein [Cryobacterium sp. AP23]